MTSSSAPPRPLLEPFRERAPWWGGDLQTLRNHVAGRPPPLPARSEPIWFPLADGDRMTGMLDAPDQPAPGAPMILLVHGLTGDEDSVYMRDAARWHLMRGRPVMRLNLRGAGRSRPFCRQRYHAGRTEDLDAVVAALPEKLTTSGLVAIGFSLGGALVAGWIGRSADPARVRAGAAISAPLDFKEAALRLAAPRNRIYQAALLRDMRAEFLNGPAAMTDAMRAGAAAARTIIDFDGSVVAPLNGYDGAFDYYARAAAGPWVPRARAPLLLLHADNDPWIPDAAHRAAAAAAPAHVRVLLTRGGGHVGFHAPGDAAPWSHRAVEHFLDDMLSGRVQAPPP